MELEDWIVDPPRPRPGHATSAHSLLESTKSGVLATLDADGHPYASLVELMPHEGAIVLFLSNLAVHTGNIKRDERASIVVHQPAVEELLAEARATFQGRITLYEERERLAEAWVARHPGAANYIGFSDFNFYGLKVEKVRYIEGFGQMGWVDEAAWEASSPDPLGAFARGVIEHMNDDHAHNLIDYAHAFCGAKWADSAVMTDLDQDGFGMVVSGDERREVLRVGFAKPVTTREQTHEIMVRLARLARQRLG